MGYEGKRFDKDQIKKQTNEFIHGWEGLNRIGIRQEKGKTRIDILQ